MKQTTLTISIPNNERDLDNEINRVSCMTYTPKSMLCRKLLREGLKNMSKEMQLKTGRLVKA